METTKRIRIKFQALSADAIIPKYGSDGAAGFDLVATEDITFVKGDTKIIPLGFATEMPDDVHARIESRSGMALKNMVVLTGVIDSDYRGEWKVIMHFAGPSEANGFCDGFKIAKGDRVAQAVLRPTVRAVFESVESLQDTTRGVGGFGSTGQR